MPSKSPKSVKQEELRETTEIIVEANRTTFVIVHQLPDIMMDGRMVE